MQGSRNGEYLVDQMQGEVGQIFTKPNKAGVIQ